MKTGEEAKMAEDKKSNETVATTPPIEQPKDIPKDKPKVIEFAAEKLKAEPVDKVSQSKKEAPKKEPEKVAKPKSEKKAEKAEKVPKPVDKAKVVYLKLSELHPFHTFR